MIFYWFWCPNGHNQLISEEQKEGKLNVVCDLCGFQGIACEGRIGEQVTSPDYMSYLKG